MKNAAPLIEASTETDDLTYPVEAVRLAYKNGLEAAAKIAESTINVKGGIGESVNLWRHHGNKQIAEAIRAALAEPAPNAEEQEDTRNLCSCVNGQHRNNQPTVAAPEEAPREAVLTAPERIWLQIGDDLDLPFPASHEDITWCSGPCQESDVEYVRADLARSLYVAWRTIEDAPYSIPILAVWPNGTQMVAFQDFMEGWQDAETRDPLENKPTHWMPLPKAHSSNASQDGQPKCRPSGG